MRSERKKGLGAFAGALQGKKRISGSCLLPRSPTRKFTRRRATRGEEKQFSLRLIPPRINPFRAGENNKACKPPHLQLVYDRVITTIDSRRDLNDFTLAGVFSPVSICLSLIFPCTTLEFPDFPFFCSIKSLKPRKKVGSFSPSL